MMNENIIVAGGWGLLGAFIFYLANKYYVNSTLTKKNIEAHELFIRRNKEYFDLTSPITNETTVFPGDPKFNIEIISSLDKGEPFNLCKMTLGNHMGTHIDFPGHVLKNGKLSDQYSISDLIGNGIIIELPPTADTINRAFVEHQDIPKNSFVFFKTKNSDRKKSACFQERYVYIEPDAALALIEKKVKVVGIDYLSVDSSELSDLPVHQILLSNDILIVENLELSNILPGPGTIYIMPIHVPGMDGLPTRVVMER